MKAKKLLTIVLYDFLFIAITTFLLDLFNIIVAKQYEKLFQINYDQLITQTPERAAEVAALMQSTYTLIITIIIIFITIIFLAWCYFQGLVYSKINNKKPTVKFILRFMHLNVIWIPSFIILLAIIQKAAKSHLQLALTIILSLLFIHFTNTLYTVFPEIKNLSSIKQSFKVAVFEFYKTALPYLILAAILFALVQINTLVQGSMPTTLIPMIKHIPFILGALVAIDLTRIYIAKTINT